MDFFQSDEGSFKDCKLYLQCLEPSMKARELFLVWEYHHKSCRSLARCRHSVIFQHYQPMPSSNENSQPKPLVDVASGEKQMFQVRLFVRPTTKGFKAQDELQHHVLHDFIHPSN